MMFFQRLISIAFITSNLGGSVHTNGANADQTSRHPPEKLTLPNRLHDTAADTSAPKQSMQTPLSAASSSSRSWSSYITVDASNILSVLVDKAGFFLDPQLRNLRRFLHCDEAKLNVARKELLISNFTVSLPTSSSSGSRGQESLKIGRIQVTWDSYSRPCLEIEVENVDILVEFVNLLFTKNNWDELSELGFPPEMLYLPTDTGDASTAASYEFIRIGNLDIKGNVTLHTRSRPLQRALTNDIAFQLDVIRELREQIRTLADQNAAQLKRRGCTSDEIYKIIQCFFNTKMKEVIKLAVEDLAAGKIDPKRESRVVNESKRVASSLRAALLDYASAVESLSKEKIKEKLRVQGEDGDSVVSDEEIDRIVSGGVDNLKLSIKSLGMKALGSFSKLRQSKNSSAVTLDDEIVFPDW